MSQNTLPAGTYDFTSFSQKTAGGNHNKQAAVGLAQTSDKYQPSAGAVEVLEKRDAYSKYYTDRDSTGKFYQLQSPEPIHFKKDGQWQTIDTKLLPLADGIFEATSQEEPVGFDINKKASYIKTLNGKVYFNQWALYGKKNGQNILLASPNWQNYTAGRDGIRVKNIFEGIDAEMRVKKGAVKTDFIVRSNAFSQYDTLFFADDFNGGQPGTGGILRHSGNPLAIEKDGGVVYQSGQGSLHIDKAIVAYKKNGVPAIQNIGYLLNGSQLSIPVAASFLNKGLLEGNVVIDPLVSTQGTLATALITGSMNCGSLTNSCAYTLNMLTPARATFTRVAFQFAYNAISPAGQHEGWFEIGIGNCTSGNYTVVDPASNTGPGPVGTWGTFAPLPSLLNCLPAPSCTQQPVVVRLRFYNTYCLGTPGCSSEYIEAEEPLIILIEGRTAELDAIAATPATICTGSSATLNVTGKYGVPPYTYAWNNGAGSGTSVSVSPTTTTIYTATITDQCGTTATGTATVTVNQLPVVAASNNGPLCQGADMELTATNVAGASYVWTGPNNFTSLTRTPTIPSAGGAASGVYTVVATSGSNCKSLPATTTVEINPSASPAVSISMAPATACEGQPLVFTATPVNGGDAPLYQWKINGNNVGGNTATATFTRSNLANGDIVTCVMTSNLPCATVNTALSNPITVTLTPTLVPSVTISASPAGTVCSGTAIQFTAAPVNGGTAPTYQWRLNETNAGNDQPTFDLATVANGDVVYCIITSNAACAVPASATSNKITITATPAVSPTISIAASAIDICGGTPVTFTATIANGGASPSYQWQLNGTNVGGNSNVYTNASLADGDRVNCMLTSTAACATSTTAASNEIVMQVSTPVTPSVSIAASATNTCAGEAIVFTATPVNGGNSPQYQWKVNGVNVGTNQPQFTSTTLTTADQVSCELTTSIACNTVATAISNSISVTVTAVTTPTVSIVASTSNTICAGTPVNFTATATNAGASPIYQWLLNGANVGSNSNVYTNNSLVSGDVVACTITSSAACNTAPQATSNSIIFTVQPVAIPSVSIVASATNVCPSTTIHFVATAVNGGSSPVWQWTVNGTPAGTNSNTFSSSSLTNGDRVAVALTSSITCVSAATVQSDVIALTILPPVTPGIVISTASDSICRGLPAVFTATATDGGATPIYQWRVNGANVGTNSASFTSSNLQTGDVVSAVLTSSVGCVTTNTAVSNNIILTVSPVITPTVSIFNPVATACAGDTLFFTASSTNGGPSPQYQWLRNGQPTSGTGTELAVSNLNNGDIITVRLTPVGVVCPVSPTLLSNPIPVTIHPIPQVNAGQDRTILRGETTPLNASATGTITSYEWSPPSYLNNRAIRNPVASPPNTTTYTLVATGVGNCQGSDSVTIKVLEPLVVPNAFSPNGDGINDVWNIAGLAGYDGAMVEVFDRFGQLVYRTKGYSIPWDGTRNGKPLPTGTYYYIITPENNFKPFTGSVTIVR